MRVNCGRKVGVVLVVELGPADDAEGDDVEPEEESNGCPEGPVDSGIVGKTGDVPAEDECGDEPHDGGDEGSWKHFPPGLPQRSAHVVDKGDEADAAGKCDCPANDQRDNEYGSTDRSHDVQADPGRNEVAKDDERACDGKGDE